MTRRRLLWLSAVSAVLSALLVWWVGWSVLHATVRGAWWEVLAARPLSDRQVQRLMRCESVGWWAWVRVLEQDADLACGERWAIEELGALVAMDDRQTWLLARLPGLATRQRVRAALALDAQEVEVPGGVDWLVMGDEVSDAQREELLTGDWSAGRGPPVRARGKLVALAAGEELDEATVATMRRLARLGGEEAAWSQAAAIQWVGVDASGLEGLGRGPHPLAMPWATAVEGVRQCTGDCAERWVDLVEALWRDPAGVAMPAMPADRGEPSAGLLEPMLALEPEDAEGLRWWLWMESDAVRTQPRRLVVDLRQGPTRDEALVRSLWTGHTEPWLGALAALEIGRRTGQEVVVLSNEEGLVLQVGDQRTPWCGVQNDRPLAPVPTEEVLARSILARRPLPVGADVAARRLAGWQGAPSQVFPWSSDLPAPPDPCQFTRSDG